MVDATPDSLDEIKRLAKAATPGLWAWEGHWLVSDRWNEPLFWYTTRDDGAHASDEDAAYIVATCPDRILALVASHRALEERVAELEGALKPFAAVNIRCHAHQPDGINVGGLTGFVKPVLEFTLGQIRRAAALLDKGAEHG